MLLDVRAVTAGYEQMEILHDVSIHVDAGDSCEILRARLHFLEERIAGLERCRQYLIDVMREVAAARSSGYSVLGSLPQVALPSPFRFGRRSQVS